MVWNCSTSCLQTGARQNVSLNAKAANKLRHDWQQSYLKYSAKNEQKKQNIRKLIAAINMTLDPRPGDYCYGGNGGYFQHIKVGNDNI